MFKAWKVRRGCCAQTHTTYAENILKLSLSLNSGATENHLSKQEKYAITTSPTKTVP